MKRILPIFSLFFLFTNSVILAQAKFNLDSLVTYNDKYLKEDTVKVKMLIRLAEEFKNKNTNSAYDYAQNSYILANKLEIAYWKGKSIYQLGEIYIKKRDWKEAKKQMELALSYFEKLPKFNDIGLCYYRIGVTFAVAFDGDNAIKNYEIALKYFEKTKNITQEAKIYGGMAAVYSDKGENKKANEYYKKALMLMEPMKNKMDLLILYSNVSNHHSRVGEYLKSLEYGQKALQLIHKSNENKLDSARILSNLGVTYFNMNEQDKSISYHNHALILYTELNDKYGISKQFTDIASSYASKKDLNRALEYYLKALPILEEVKNKRSLAYGLEGIANVYTDLERFEESIAYYNRSLPLFQEIDDKESVARVHNSIAKFYVLCSNEVLNKIGVALKDRFKKAEEENQKGLEIASKNNMLHIVKESWFGLSQAYERKEEFPKAYDAYKKYIAIKDSISGDEVKKQITRKEIQFEYDKKEDALKFEQKLTTEQLEKQKILTLQQQQSLTLKEQALQLSNKEADLQRLAYLKEKAEKQEKEQALNLAEKDKQLQASELITLVKEKALQVQTLAKQNALIAFLLATLAALGLGVGVFYLLQRQKQAKKAAAIQAQFTQQLLENTEVERERIAHDLHDGISHELLTLKRSFLKGEDLKNSTERIDAIIEDIRQISRNLHPVMLDKIGLKISIETLCEQFAQDETLFVSHELDFSAKLAPTAELQVFRIIQEALTNTVKYAKAEASKVTIEEKNNALSIEIKDNGKGFDVKNALDSGKSFGLHSIIQRSKALGGEAKISSSDGGTLIHVEIPIDKKAA